jgi:hypothetical protein
VAHHNLKAAFTATMVIARLTHGPHNIVPAITANAKSGQNDLPSKSPVSDRNPCVKRLIAALWPF